MQEKVCDLIYLDTKRYISLDTLRMFFGRIILIPLVIMVMSFASISTMGISVKTLFPLISIVSWSLLYWIFVLTIQHKKTKKTFDLRFLVNGILGLFISSLFWLLYISFDLVTDVPIFGVDFLLWILFFYLLFSILYIALVVLGVHKGFYKKIREKNQAPKALAISAFFTSILPLTGILGIYTSRILRNYANVNIKHIFATVSFVLLIFLPILGHINFVQYFYCKKYKILCDEYGNTTSPKLERQVKKKKTTKEKMPPKESTDKNLSKKKKVPLIIKILIGMISVLIIFFIIVFLVFFIKGFIQGIS